MPKSPEGRQPSEKEMLGAVESMTELESKASEARERLLNVRKELGIQTDDLKLHYDSSDSVDVLEGRSWVRDYNHSSLSESMFGSVDGGPRFQVRKFGILGHREIAKHQELGGFGAPEKWDNTTYDGDIRHLIEGKTSRYGIEMSKEDAESVFKRLRKLAVAHEESDVAEILAIQERNAELLKTREENEIERQNLAEESITGKEPGQEEKEVLEYIHEKLLGKKN